MVSDIGTKGLSPAIFHHLSDYMLGVKSLDEITDFVNSLSKRE